MALMVLTPISMSVGLLTGVVAMVSLVAAGRKQRPHDAERAALDLTMKLRHPWRYRLEQLSRWGANE